MAKFILPTEEEIDGYSVETLKSWINRAQLKTTPNSDGVSQIETSLDKAKARLQKVSNLVNVLPSRLEYAKAKLEAMQGGVKKLDANTIAAMLKGGRLDKSVLVEAARAAGLID